MVTLVLSVLNIICFFIVLLMHLPTHASFVCKILWDTPSYIAYTGAYSQTMVIHAFCNVDDVSWGTKGSSGNGGKKYEVDKVLFVCSW
jgi:chitin synthase